MIAFGVALFFLLAGRTMLAYLGVTIHAFAISGGVLLLLAIAEISSLPPQSMLKHIKTLNELQADFGDLTEQQLGIEISWWRHAQNPPKTIARELYFEG